MPITINNHGQLIESTNYWETLAPTGKLYCSCNAGAIRILLPRAHMGMVGECRSAEYAILSRGPSREFGSDAVEILFEDGSDSPYAIHLSQESFDLLPAEPEPGREWIVSLWVLNPKNGKPKKALERKCLWRRVESIPCLRPWKS